jgi:hypothetical protein
LKSKTVNTISKIRPMTEAITKATKRAFKLGAMRAPPKRKMSEAARTPIAVRTDSGVKKAEYEDTQVAIIIVIVNNKM